MSAAAIMLVKDEADIIRGTLRHLLSQVDEVIVCDNGSSDETAEIAGAMAHVLLRDDDLGYFQSKKVTNLAEIAHGRGHEWVVPCDADEIWSAPGEQTVAAYLAGMPQYVNVVTARVFDYLPPRSGLNGLAPHAAITYRFPEAARLPKVACRVLPGLVIEMGNHGAFYPEKVTSRDGLTVRHFSWRTREQYLRKIRNGIAAYEATDFDPIYGWHWRRFSGATDEAIMAHFDEHFSIDYAPPDMVYDPVSP